MEPRGFRIHTTLAVEEVAEQCNLIVTCTPSKVPLLSVDQIRKGTHITAMGSDTAEKQELDPRILAKADRVVADSISQVLVRGESFKALTAGLIDKEKLVELGSVIARPELRRSSDEEITVADLTGVAVQDIQIAKAVLRGLS
jgi:ornithine cyclodeaminase